MRYCKLFLDHKTIAYASVTERDHELFASALMSNPLVLDEAVPSASFAPVAVSTLEREGRLLVPVTPTKIVCVGRNYRDHAAELGNDVPAEPLLFLKPPSSLLPAGGVIEMPAISKRVDFEGELAIVIGKRARKLTEADDVAPYIHGYTCLNDVTARDIQKSDPQWTRGKGFDTFCSAGPIVSDEIHPLTENVSLTTHLNGEVKQRGETRDLIFPIAHLIRYISQCMTLEPGDLIATGTPAGVGPMKAGDVVEVEIAGLGTLRNRVENG
jgi:2-keto-4-pentenoate hydratase/2-oxohepta-3-ene-1,7-dioic acid hydratase in catechol pathway